MRVDRRPLSPHLQVYRPQLTSVLSILHRFTGVVLALGSLFLVIWLVALSAGPQAYGSFIALASHPLALIVLAIGLLAFFYHLLNGIRHLFWDAGWLLELRGAYASGWVVVIASVVLTALVWGAVQ